MKRRNPPLHHRARVFGTARAVAAELIEAMAQIGIVAAQAALGEDRSDLGSHLACAVARGIDHHARQPRR